MVKIKNKSLHRIYHSPFV